VGEKSAEEVLHQPSYSDTGGRRRSSVLSKSVGKESWARKRGKSSGVLFFVVLRKKGDQRSSLTEEKVLGRRQISCRRSGGKKLPWISGGKKPSEREKPAWGEKGFFSSKRLKKEGRVVHLSPGPA